MKKLLWTMITMLVALSNADVGLGDLGGFPRIDDAYIITEEVDQTSISIAWQKARDIETPQAQLEYRVYYSLDSLMDRVEEIETSGISTEDFARDIRRAKIRGLTPETGYYVNVVVRDGHGNRAAYGKKRIFTHLGAAYEQLIDVQDPGSSLPQDWWRQAVFYQCYVRAFRDSDGDGCGDLPGLIEKLDYLKELGVRGIWLMPVMKSSDNLHGYATTDYRDIEEDYGTLDDFRLLLHEAHRRGIGVIIDFVINHSSSWHPFFVDSEAGPASAYRNWYIWESRKPGHWPVPTVSSDSWRQGTTGYYYAPFWRQMPEWNFRSMAVKNYMADNFKFWLNLGVDGYRLDAVQHLIENGPGGLLEQPESHLYFQYLRAVMDRYQNRFMVCEHGGWEYLGEHEFHSGFAFGFNHRLVEAVRDQRPWILDADIRNGILRAPRGSKYAIFLSNHDFFAGRRPYDQLGGDDQKCKLAASLLLTLPGIPFVYYGEEIGMTSSNEYQRDFSLRTPMQWHAGLNAGFTSGTPFRTLNENFATDNVAVQRADSSSILNHYIRMIAIRNHHPALQSGDYQRVPTDDDGTFFAFLRSNDESTVLVVLNFSGEERSVALDFTGTRLEDQDRRAGDDLYERDVVHRDLTVENFTAYRMTRVPAFGIRIFALE